MPKVTLKKRTRQAKKRMRAVVQEREKLEGDLDRLKGDVNYLENQYRPRRPVLGKTLADLGRLSKSGRPR